MSARVHHDGEKYKHPQGSCGKNDRKCHICRITATVCLHRGRA